MAELDHAAPAPRTPTDLPPPALDRAATIPADMSPPPRHYTDQTDAERADLGRRAQEFAPRVMALSEGDARAAAESVGGMSARDRRDPKDYLLRQHPDDIEAALAAVDTPDPPLDIRYGKPRLPAKDALARADRPRDESLASETAVSELSDSDLTPDERATFERQSSPRELSSDDLTPAERASFERQSGDTAGRELTGQIAEDSRAQGAADADRNGLRAAVDEVLAGAEGAPKVEFVRDEDGLPEGTRLQSHGGRKVRREGLYDPDTQQVHILTENVTTPERAAWVAAHEIAGHHGLRGLMGERALADGRKAKDVLDAALDTARQNPTVAKLADAIGAQRKSGNPRLMAEEAIAELAAATRTGNWDHLRDRYGVDVPEGIREGAKTAVRRFVERIKALLAKLFKKARFSDVDVHQLVEDAWQYVRKPRERARAEPARETARESVAEPREESLESVGFTPEQRDFMRKAGMSDVVDQKTSLRKAMDWALGKFDDLKALGDKDALAQSVADRFHGIKRAESEKGGIEFGDSAYIAARQLNTASTMEAILRFGAPKLVDGVLRVDRSTPGLLDALQPVADTMPQFLGWLVAGRARYLKQQGRENLMSDADIRAGLSLSAGHEDAFKKAAAGYIKIKTAILDLAEKAGTINAEDRKVWDHNEYVPFHRVSEGGFAGPGTRRGLANQSAGIRKLKGGENALRDPLGNIIANFTRLVDSAMKNRATLMAIDNLGAPYVKKAPHQFAPASIPADQVKKYLVDSGVPDEIVEGLAPDTLHGVARMLSIKAPEGDNVIRVMRNGKPEYYEVDDPLLLESLTAFNEEPMAPWVRPFAWFKQLLTAGATMVPEFAGANLLRDTGEASITSRDRFVPVIDTLRGAVDQFRESELTQDLMMAGSYFHGGLFRMGDVEDTAKAVRRVLRKHGIAEGKIEHVIKSLFNPARWWDIYRSFIEASEMGSRISLARKRQAAGGSFLESAHEAKDFLDFSMRGNANFVRFLTSIMPFLNARIQGAYRLGRVASTGGRRGKMAARMAAVALASVGLYLWNQKHHKEAYDDLPEWDKDTYWHIAPGTKYHMRIPKPFELGLAAATLPERMYAAMQYQLTKGQEGDRPAQSADALWRAITGTLALDPLPQAVKPAAEVAFNYDTFFGRPIESFGDKYKLPEDRFNATTSPTMKAVSRGMGDVVGERNALSPKKLQHLWHGYTAGIGDYLVGASDWVLRQGEQEPPQPEKALRDFPFVGRFAQGDTPPKSTRYTDDFYSLLDQARDAKGSIKAAQKDGNTARARNLYNENRWLLGARTDEPDEEGGSYGYGGLKTLERQARVLSGIRKKDQAIYDDMNMTPAQKRTALDANAKERNDIVRKYARQFRELQRQAAYDQSGPLR
jgi:hypothetical protein